MEASCDPTKWNYIDPELWKNVPKVEEIREERASRTKVCMIDYEQDTVRRSVEFSKIQDLKSWLELPGNSSQKV